MKDFPFVSVIIPSFNSRQYLIRCLSSLMKLDYPGQKLDIVVVDDSSSDGSADLIKSGFASVNIIRNKKRQGPAEARNIGMKAAKGDLIAFLDSDVEVEKNWLKPLVEAIAGDNKIGICSSKALFLDDKNKINSAGGSVNIYGDGWGRGVFETDDRQYDGKKDVFYGCSAAMLTKKEIIEKIGCFDRDYFYLYEDLDYGWRANMAGYRAVYVPESVVYHKFGAVMKRGNFLVRYFTERNRIQTILKNYEVKTLVKIFPAFLGIRAYKTVNTFNSQKKMKFGCFMSFLMAWLWNTVNVHKTIKKRSVVQAFRKISDKEIFQLMGDYKYKIFMR